MVWLQEGLRYQVSQEVAVRIACLSSRLSATSGTIFACRKLPYRDLLLLTAHFVNAVKGISAIRMSHELEVTYKTAFVWKHKLRSDYH